MELQEEELSGACYLKSPWGHPIFIVQPQPVVLGTAAPVVGWTVAGGGGLLEEGRIAGVEPVFPAALGNKGGGLSSPEGAGGCTPEGRGQQKPDNQREGTNRSDGSVMAAFVEEP